MFFCLLGAQSSAKRNRLLGQVSLYVDEDIMSEDRTLAVLIKAFLQELHIKALGSCLHRLVRNFAGPGHLHRNNTTLDTGLVTSTLPRILMLWLLQAYYLDTCRASSLISTFVSLACIWRV